MHLSALLASSLLASTTVARRSLQHVGRRDPVPVSQPAPPRNVARAEYGGTARQKIASTNATKSFAVNGTGLPFVNFDIGESYAGLLPISNKTNVSELYFWFFPSDNPLADDEILIWLNGGPGCSSLEGLLQENGPFLWQYGTYEPVQNPWTWVNLTNVVWVEQPAGTGFSPVKGTPQATNEAEVAMQFLGFWKNFVDTFGLQNRKIYITGESYAGFYVPTIADAMHNQSNTEYYNIESILFNDPVLSSGAIQNEIPAYPMVEYWAPVASLNETYMSYLAGLHESCGYAKFMQEAFTFPPKGPLPSPPSDANGGKCDVYGKASAAMTEKNPCWDSIVVYYDADFSSSNLWDVLGFPGSFDYEPAPWVYFNRKDVKTHINAPVSHQWSECQSPVLATDTSVPVGQSGLLSRVIEKNNKTIIGHGMADFVLLVNGTIMTIQNMTWNGAQGFSKPPSDWNEFYVPYHPQYSYGSYAGAGIFGNWWEERGLTFVSVDLSGHMIPQYQPSASYRKLEYLLGRIGNLSDTSGFST